MKPELVVLDEQQSIEELRQYLSQFDYIAYDTETTGVDKGSDIIGISVCAEETKAFYIILKEWSKENQMLIDLQLNISPLLKDLQSKSLIMHNALFDCSITRDIFKTDLMPSLHTDTIILAHLLNENRKVGLKELSAIAFGVDSTEEQRLMKDSVLANGGKLTKDCYEMYKADSRLLGKYGAKDALLTYKLFFVLVEELYSQGLEDFFYKDESMPLLKGPTYHLNTTGLKVDQEYLAKLKNELIAECLEANDFVNSEIKSKVAIKYPGTSKKNTFNMASRQQLSWLLFGQMGLAFNTLTKEGRSVCKALGLKLPYAPSSKRDFIAMCIRSVGQVYQPEGFINGKKQRAKKVKEPWAYTAVDKKTLSRYAPKYKWIAALLELKKKSKILETYVMGIEERTKYGIIHPSFLQHGTTSGRYSSRNPNFQNLPRDDKRVKSSIIARPGKVFVGADYSQLEPRVFAYYSRDERLLSAFKGTDDFYSTIGMEVYDKTDCRPIKDGAPDAFGIKYKKLRDLSKVIALASTYGATAHQLATTTGKSIEDTQADINSYFEKFPGVRDMMLEAHKIAKETGQVTNIFGRPRRIPEATRITKHKEHAELPYQARSLLNLAVNHRIQSTGASIVNRAAIDFLKKTEECLISCNLVLQVHDSLVVECDEADAENISLLLQYSMENAVRLEGIELEAIPKIGKTLAEV